MKLIYRTFLTICLLTLVFRISYAEPKEKRSNSVQENVLEITKESIDSLIEQFDRAIKEHKSELLEPLLSDELKIINGTNKMSKSEYLDFLKKGWEKQNKNEFIRTRKNLKIEIEKGGKKAVLKNTVIDQTSDDEEYFVNEESIILELRNQKILITSLEWVLGCAKTRDGTFID